MVDNIVDNTEQKTDRQMINEFLIANDEHETKLTLDFAKALLALEIEIKGIRDDQKEIKTDAKANGVSVTKVNKVLNNMKKVLKESPGDLSEMETIENVFSHDVDIKTMIANLTAK